MTSLWGFIPVFAATFTWAAASVIYKFGIGAAGGESRDPITAFAVKILVVFIFMGSFSVITGEIGSISDCGIEYWLYSGIAGAVSVLGELSYFYALRLIDSSRLFPIINTQTLFTFPLAYFVLGESPGIAPVLAAVPVMSGVFLIGGRTDYDDKNMDMLDAQTRSSNHKKGVLLGILTGFLWASIYISMALQNRTGGSFAVNNAVRCMFAAAYVWIPIVITRRHLPPSFKKNRKDFNKYLFMGITGIFSFGIGDTLYQIGIKEIGANAGIIIASGAPLINQILAITFLKEKFRKNILLGAILIMIGNIIVIFG